VKIAPTLCKGFGRRIQDHRIVEQELIFVVYLAGNRGENFVVGSLYVAHPSNVYIISL
jgi:hypothetical protein